MKSSFICIIIILSVFCSHVFAGTLKGKVLDDKGAPLPYATVYVEGTTMGTTTNGDGSYELVLPEGLHQVLCQYMGFKQLKYNVTIKGDEQVLHTFNMAAQGLDMKEVVVLASREDPAYRIIREAIKRRKFHLSQVSSFQSSIYLKGVGRSRQLPKKFMGQKINSGDMGADSTGKGVIYLVEQNADYYREGKNERTIIHSVHESGNNNGLGFSKFPPVISFYENNVAILAGKSRGFISPISDNALTYYKYKLQGKFTEQGNTIYKIQVTQKRPFEPCFNGTIYINDSEWAIHSLNMTLVKESGIDVMDTLRLDQLFVPVGKDNWVIKSQVMYLTINMFGFDVTATGVTVYNNQKVNETIADSIFNNHITSSYDKIANKKDSVYWATNRPIPLEGDEKKDFVIKDSISKVEEDPKHIDSLRRKGNKFSIMSALISGYTYRTAMYKTTYVTNSLLLGLATDNIVNFNIVEGFNVAPKVSFYHTIDTGHYLNGAVAARYGFSNTHFNAIGKLYYVSSDKAWRGRSWLMGVEGGQYVFQYYGMNPVLQWFNTYAALFYRNNDLKIYERREASAYLGRNYGNGLRWFVKTSLQRRLPLSNTTNYSFFAGRADAYKENYPPVLAAVAEPWQAHNAALVNATIAYKPGITYTQYPDYKVANSSKWPVLTLNYQKGIPGIMDSKSDFDKWRFGISDNIKLKLAGELSYNVIAGGFLNTRYVAAPDLMHLYGNRGIGYVSPYLMSYQFAQYYEFSNKDQFYGEVHLEYHLNGLITNKIPLFKKAKWYLLMGTNSFHSINKEYYTEAFVGFDNIGYKAFRILRVDFVQSWDSHMGHNSGIRFGLSSANFTVNKNNPTNSEW